MSPIAATAAGHQGQIERALPGGLCVVVDLKQEIPIGAVGTFPEQQLDDVWIRDPRDGWRKQDRHTPLGAVDAVSMSEIIRELREATS